MNVADIFESMDYGTAPESAADALAWLVDQGDAFGHFIGGSFTDPRADFEAKNPATGEVLATLTQATQDEVDAAVAAARDAQPGWAALGGHGRAKVLYALARLLQKHARLFAVLETLDNGKPIRESRDIDIPLAQRHFYYHAGMAQLMEAELPGRAPLGVCGQIVPWNFPLLMLAWKIAPALACGNTVVLKPAETTSLTALRFAEICSEIGLPKGVVNIVTGAGETGKAIVEHSDINKIAFTGSTQVGKMIAKSVAATDKKLTLELGGKSANIIFEDASLDQAIEGIIEGIYFNQGHVCCAGSRLFVQESILDTVIDKLNDRMGSLRVGDPMDKNTDVGAINSKEQLATIKKYLALGDEEGAVRHDACGSALPEKGYWCKPCFYSGVQPSHTIAREEIFGPVLAVMSFRTPDEAISRANNSPYGLAAGVWTDKGSKIFDVARRLDAGVVWLNTYNKFDPTSPFGGYKESGFGREGGRHGLMAYCQ